MTETITSLCQALLDQSEAGARLLVAIAGAPGSGKSTFTEALHEALGGDAGPSVVVPMDGFHLDDAILEPRGWRSVKGAPHTFDVAGMHRALAAIQADEGNVYIPVFDRSRELARNAARCVEGRHRIVLVEGNYLLFSQAPWSALAELFDLGVYLDVPLGILERRLMQRWLDQGFDEAAAAVKVYGNDLANAREIIAFRREADWVIGVD